MIEIFNYQNGYYFCLRIGINTYYSKIYTEDKEVSLNHFMNELKKDFPDEDLKNITFHT